MLSGRMTGWRRAELALGLHRRTLTNARTERPTGRTATWRDLKAVRANDTRWGEP